MADIPAAEPAPEPEPTARPCPHCGGELAGLFVPLTAEDELPGELQGLRKAAGFSQSELAHTLEVERSTVSSVETGHIKPGSALVDRWRKACHRRAGKEQA